MPVAWTQTGENGLFEAVIDLEDGSQKQSFRGASEREVADKLANAQLHASRRIRELRAALPVEQAKAPRPASQPLTADQRFQIARDITDPAKSDKAVAALLAAQGIPVEDVRRIITTQREQQEHDEAFNESQAFVVATPNWNPSAHNKTVLVNYMRTQGMAPTRNNMTLAFEQLSEAGLLQPMPEETAHPEPETDPEPIARATTRPRNTVSTGIRSSQGRSAAPAPTTRSKYTKQAIRNMPAVEYARRLQHESGFAAAVEAAV